MDHINGKPHDNRFVNLQVMTLRQHAAKTHKTRTYERRDARFYCPQNAVQKFPNEIWKPVVCPISGAAIPLYEVSCYSRIRNKKTGRLLQYHDFSKDGREKVCILVNGKQRNIPRYALSTAAFYGPRPSKHHSVDHLDRNVSNNHVDNLAWQTTRQQSCNRKSVPTVTRTLPDGSSQTFQSQREASSKCDKIWLSDISFSRATGLPSRQGCKWSPPMKLLPQHQVVLCETGETHPSLFHSAHALGESVQAQYRRMRDGTLRYTTPRVIIVDEADLKGPYDKYWGGSFLKDMERAAQEICAAKTQTNGSGVYHTNVEAGRKRTRRVAFGHEHPSLSEIQ